MTLSSYVILAKITNHILWGGFLEPADGLGYSPQGNLSLCSHGEIGRRNGLKIRWLQGRAGSIPAESTSPSQIRVRFINQDGGVHDTSIRRTAL